MEFLTGHEAVKVWERSPERALRFVAGVGAELWLTEGRDVKVEEEAGVALRRADEGLFGEVVEGLDGGLEAAVERAWDRALAFAKARGARIIRVWSWLPSVEGAEAALNRGRWSAMARAWGEATEGWSPPASAEAFGASGDSPGGAGDRVRLEFWATPHAHTLLENRTLRPGLEVEAPPGERPAARARGVIHDHRGQRLLFSSAASGRERGGLARAAFPAEPEGAGAGGPGEAGESGDEVYRAVEHLRTLVSQFNLKPHGIDYGFGLEDLVLLVVSGGGGEAALRPLVERIVDPDCRLAFRGSGGDEGVRLEGVFLKKGEYLAQPRRKYEEIDGRLRVESLEVHIAEHCNLRCRGCDAMSPYNERRFMPLEEVEAILARMAPLMRADIFKLMGGEPTLHPQIVEILAAVRRSGITAVIRLTTNGLLLHRMPEGFWAGLDRLTVSNYASAPIPAEHVALIRRKAREHAVVLNLKYIDQFNEISLTEPIEDAAQVKRQYDDCWIRHRSLIVRGGLFFKCTRAAYMDDFSARIGLQVRAPDPESFKEVDGIPVDDPDFGARALAYLNAPEPLAACRWCLGAAGALMAHRQLTRREVKAGVV